MLATTVAIHDPQRCDPRYCVHDVEGFVNATINAFERGDRPEWAAIRGGEREELVLEGIAIMYQLERRYEPQRGNHAQGGWFSGFAAYFLPKKLGEAWHRLHENHRYVTDPETGKRRWVYLQEASSLDALRRGPGDDCDDSIETRVLRSTHWTPVAEAA